MPVLPEPWEDHSWHNDVCPHFMHKEREVELWFEHARPEDREFPNSARYSIQQMSGHEFVEQLYACEDWADMEAELIRRELLPSKS